MDETLDIWGAAAFLKISRWSIYQLTRKNKIPCHRPTGKKLIFIKSELEKFLLGKKNQSKKSGHKPG
jgi:excisionase family DNA binding protein